MSFFTPTAQEFKQISSAVQAAAKKAQTPKRDLDHSSSYKKQIEDLTRLVADTVRQSDECEQRLGELQAAIDSNTSLLASLRAAGVNEKSDAITRIIGANFYSKAQQTSVHWDGILDKLKDALASTEKRSSVLNKAAKNVEQRAVKELPVLREKLAEALKLEKLEGR